MPKSTNDTEKKKTTKRAKKEDIVEKEVEKKSTKKNSTKANTTKSKTTSSTKKTSSSAKAKETTKTSKSTTKKTSTTAKSKSTAKKTTTTRTKKTAKKEEIVTSLEYYDLPYRYNQTMVKILAQTPNTLFIYWDISDEDRSKLQEQYGEDFFNSTKPVLILHNETKNYSFEVEINDFANSWYLNIADTDCKYNIELGRRFIKDYYSEKTNNYISNNNYIFISTSNNLITPNDHILTLKYNANTKVQFKNIKNNNYYFKELKNIPFDFYNIYSKEILEDLPFNKFTNPSSNFIKN